MNYYVVSNEAGDRFLNASGEWVESMDDAEHMTIERAVERQVELIRREIITELFEVPLMHEAMYEDLHARIDDVQGSLEAVGVELTTHIGQGDETTWTMVFPGGFTLRMKLAGPEAWEVIK